MADLEHITAEGETYDIADATARTDIESLQTENAELKAQIAEMEEEISELNSDLNFFNQGTEIPANSDLNDYKTLGKYFIQGSNAGSISSLPTTSSNGRSVYVVQIGVSTILQLCIEGATSLTSGRMAARTYVSSIGTWSSWFAFTLAEI